MRYSFALASLVMRYAQLGLRFKAIANCFKSNTRNENLSIFTTDSSIISKFLFSCPCVCVCVIGVVEILYHSHLVPVRRESHPAFLFPFSPLFFCFISICVFIYLSLFHSFDPPLFLVPYICVCMY